MSLTPDELRLIWTLHAEGLSAQAIGHRLNRDRRTVGRALKRAGLPLIEPPIALPARPEPAAPAQPAQPAAAVEDRVVAARARLWDVLMDPNSTGQATVQAFNALAESEGWATAPLKPLPEPTCEADVLERWGELFLSYPEAFRARLHAHLAELLQR